PDAVVAEMLLHLRDQDARSLAVPLGDVDPKCVVDLRQLAREDRIHDDALDLDDPTGLLLLFVRHDSPGRGTMDRGADDRGGRASATQSIGPPSERPQLNLGFTPRAAARTALTEAGQKRGAGRTGRDPASGLFPPAARA